MRRLKRLGRLLAGPAGRGPAVALAVIAALAAFLATAGPRESAALQDTALHQTLAANSAAGAGLYANATWDMTGTAPSQLLSAQQMQLAGRVLSSFLVRAAEVGSRALRPGPGTTAPQLHGVTNPAARAVLSEPPQIELGYRSALAAQRPAGRRVVPGHRH